jgi:hypothetical protein
MKTIYKIRPKSKNKNNNQTPGTRGEVIVSITHSLVVERSYLSPGWGYSYYNYYTKISFASSWLIL